MNLTPTHCVSQSSPRTRALVLSSALFGLLVCAANSASAQSNVSSSDEDGDGLSLIQEKVLGTNPSIADTDGDGASDLEEVARGSSPLSAGSQPDLSKMIGVGLTASAQPDGLHTLICFYMSDTNLRDKSLQVGFFSNDRVTVMSDTFLASNSTIDFKPSITPSGAVAVIDLRLNASLVQATNHLTLWARAAVPGFEAEKACSVMQMTNINGVAAFAMPAPAPVIAQSSPYSGQTPQNGRGTIYVPLVPPATGSGSLGAPAGWAGGEVCFQRSSLVGVTGSTLTNEIVSAECASGWEGYCPPSCTSTVGSTYTTVDPLVLLGG